MNILSVTLERRIRLIDEDQLIGTFYRTIHPDQSQAVLSAVEHDIGLPGGYFYRENGELALISTEEALAEDELNAEAQSFILSGWANMTYAGAVWVAIIHTDCIVDAQIIAYENSDEARAKAFVDALNKRTSLAQ